MEGFSGVTYYYDRLLLFLRAHFCSRYFFLFLVSAVSVARAVKRVAESMLRGPYYLRVIDEFLCAQAFDT